MQALHSVLEQIALWIDLVGIAIVMYGFGLAAWDLIGSEFARLRGSFSIHRMHEVRIQLGGYILTAIEFMIASDIIHTVLSRELVDLAFVSALVVIRTAISFFLSREVNELASMRESEALSSSQVQSK